MRPLDRLFAWFIPPQMHDDPIVLARAKSLVALSLASAMAGPAFITVYYALGHTRGAIAILCILLTIPLVQVALRVFHSLAWARALYLVSFTALFAYLVWSTGGAMELSLASWFLLVPVIATFSGGPVYGGIALGLVFMLVTLFAAAPWLGYAYPPTPVTDMRLLGICGTLGLIPFIGLVVISFQIAKEQSDTVRESQLDTIRRLISEVRAQGLQVSLSVADMAQSLQSQAEQAQAVRETTDANNALAQRMGSGASALAGGVLLANQAAAEGAEVVGSAIAKTVALAEAINTANELIASLHARSNDISATTEQIKQLAFQTNILALNATIEAAHAGQHGRGFAVVAGSVRQLASEASHAASAISQELAAVLDTVGNAARLLADGQALAASGRAEAGKARDALQRIMDATSVLKKEASELERMGHAQVSKNADLLRHSAEMEEGIQTVAQGSHTIRDAMSMLSQQFDVEHVQV